MKSNKKCQYCGKQNKHKASCKIVIDKKQKEEKDIQDKLNEEIKIAKEKEENERIEIDKIVEFIGGCDVDGEVNDDVKYAFWECVVGPPPSCCGEYLNTAA